jgi:hypothetical protein
VIEFESGGLKYQALTRNSVTVMFAHLPSHVHEYAILQVAISNGAKIYYTVTPENFVYYREDGTAIEPTPARDVVKTAPAASKEGGMDVREKRTPRLSTGARPHPLTAAEARRSRCRSPVPSR